MNKRLQITWRKLTEKEKKEKKLYVTAHLSWKKDKQHHSTLLSGLEGEKGAFMLGGLKVAIEYFSNRVKIQALKTNTVVAKNHDAIAYFLS